MAPCRECFHASSLAGAAAVLFVAALAGAAAPPNVVLVITDDQGYGDLGCHGNRSIRTPNLDRLHSAAIRFTNFHVSPTCSPTRAALLTGRYSNATGVWHTIMGRSLLHPDEVTMADRFRASGYRTGIFGKWHLGDNYPSRPRDNGFDEAIVHGGGGVWQTPDYFGNDYFDDTYFHNGTPEKFRGFCTDVWFESAMKFIAAAAGEGKPFFCYLSTNAPHAPMWSPEPYAKPYLGIKGLEEPGFYGMIANIDDNIGRLERFLDARGLAANTILVFMTDNGSAAGAQVFNAEMRGRKGSPYEGGHRVPLFVRWPGGGLGASREIDALAAHVDLLPTLAELCGLKNVAGPELHGRSLKALLDGSASVWPDRAIVVDSQRMEFLRPWRRTAVMTAQWRLVNNTLDGDPAATELYDIRKDPGQRRNFANDFPGVVAARKAEYEAWWKLVSGRASEYVRIALGSEEENPSRLTAHDWHSEGAEQVWSQRGIRQAPAVNGFWAVRVERAGRYRIELRRWPRELDLPINAPYKDAEPNNEPAPGIAIAAVKARLRIAGFDQTSEVRPADKAAVFTTILRPGPAELQTWFYDRDGTERGAYYVYVEWTGAGSPPKTVE
ncbi:MAG: arylsulfatase [Bryobacteraceae bacterium]|nr:arylsulfatase [Bryobacteraceae bacterium]